MRKLVSILLLTTSFSLSAQEMQWDDWKVYSRRTQIELGVLNLSYAIWMNTKQFYIPEKTQKWLVPTISFPVMGFSVYKAIEYHQRKPYAKRFNYRDRGNKPFRW